LNETFSIIQNVSFISCDEFVKLEIESLKDWVAQGYENFKCLLRRPRGCGFESQPRYRDHLSYTINWDQKHES
jgi:hypothetical protein